VRKMKQLERDDGHPELGAGAPVQLYPAQAVAKTPVNSINVMLNHVNTIAASLNSRVHATNSAMDDVTRDDLELGLKHVKELSGHLREGAAHVLRIANKTVHPRLGSSASPKPAASAADKKTIQQLKAKIEEQHAKLHSTQVQLKAATGSQAKKNKDIAKNWAKNHFKRWNNEARKFTAKLMVLKKDAKRKHIARVSVAEWLSQEKIVDESADDLRTQKYRGDRSVDKFLESRESATRAAKSMRVLKKKHLWAKQAFTGFGPKMSPERANASAVARQVAKQREDAKKKMLKLGKKAKKAMAWRIRAQKAERATAYAMMKALQKQLKLQKQHYENKLLAMKYKVKAEITRRTSCKAVSAKIRLARKKCRCGDLSRWGFHESQDENKVAVVKLGAENRWCKREVERCKFAHRKAGMVYAAPMRNNTYATYASTGAVPSPPKGSAAGSAKGSAKRKM